MKNARILRPQTWRDVIHFFDKNPQFVFRGQSNTKWGLSTNIERTCLNNKFPTDFIDNRETVILHEFQRRAHHYINNPPDLNNKLEWYSLLQHFGGPTRLLDFTKSFYIAAFFAMESSSNDAAIWALNSEYLYQHTDNIIGEGETIYNLEQKSRDVVENNLSHEHEELLVMAAEPERLNERISIQQGLFVIPGNVNESFESNLAITYDLDQENINDLKRSDGEDLLNIKDEEFYEVGVVKIILPIEIHNTALHDLNNMNINASTLFPGIDGFARSLKIYLRDVT